MNGYSSTSSFKRTLGSSKIPMIFAALFLSWGCDEETEEWECFSDEECTGETMCIGLECRDAFNRFYTIGSFSAEIVSSEQNWDISGGAPDPYVCVKVDGELLGCTVAKENTWRPSWSESWNFNPSPGSEIQFLVYDWDDVSSSELMINCGDEITIDLLRGNLTGCTTGLGDKLHFAVWLK